MSPGPAADPPHISVIMPCLNGLPFLREAVAGVLAQSVSMELLYVDGGSTDGSMEWVESLAHPAVRTFSVPPGTPPGDARNLGAREARGGWLAFADADDVWRPDKLQRQLAALRGSDAKLVFSDCEVVDAEGRGLGGFQQRHQPRSGRVFSDLLDGNFVPLSTVVVERQALLDAGGFPAGLRIASDYLLLLKLARRVPFLFVPEELVRYRIHPGNMTGDFRRTYAENLSLLDRLSVELVGMDPEERDAVNRAGALIYWRWAIQEWMAGPSAWPEVPALATRAMNRAGGMAQGLRTLVAAMRGALRGLGVRLKMRAARRGPS